MVNCDMVDDEMVNYEMVDDEMVDGRNLLIYLIISYLSHQLTILSNICLTNLPSHQYICLTNLPYYQLSVSPTYHVINYLSHQLTISSIICVSPTYHVINYLCLTNLPCHQLSVSPTYHVINYLSHQLTMSSYDLSYHVIMIILSKVDSCLSLSLLVVSHHHSLILSSGEIVR